MDHSFFIVAANIEMILPKPTKNVDKYTIHTNIIHKTSFNHLLLFIHDKYQT